MESLLPGLKRGLAFSLGAMGSPTTNFYNQAYQRGGYQDAAAQVQRLWVAGRREETIAAVPDELAGKRLHAAVRRAQDSTLNSLGLRKHCATRLARTEMPSIIEIGTEPLPKTSTGKVDRKRVLAQLEEKTHANG